MSIELRASGLTDPGLIRDQNQDCLYMDEAQGCFLVADGMGGAAAGEKASQCMQNTVVEHLSLHKQGSLVDPAASITGCFQVANARMLAHTVFTPADKGMGCTAELLLVDRVQARFTLGHVGDSRTYRLRQGHLEQLTKDHTLVQLQQDQGRISQIQAHQHALQHIILRAVGTEAKLEVDLIHGTLQAGDILLLCSDGLTSMVDEEQVSMVLQYQGPPLLKATMLIDLANQAGGKDNSTVLIVEIS